MLNVTETVFIDEAELEETFIRSPGAGGQNVNKVATAVQLRFDAKRSTAISDAVFKRLKTLCGKRMTADGVVVLTASRFRTQAANREDARARLAELIAKALVAPKHRRATKPSKAARQERMEVKKQRGDVKKTRSRVRSTNHD